MHSGLVCIEFGVRCSCIGLYIMELLETKLFKVPMT